MVSKSSKTARDSGVISAAPAPSTGLLTTILLGKPEGKSKKSKKVVAVPDAELDDIFKTSVSDRAAALVICS